MKKKTSITFLVFLVALIVGGGVFYMTSQHKIQTKKSAPLPVVVEAEKAQSQRWSQQIKSTGTLEAIHGIMVKSALQGGIVVKLAFKSGQYVKKGQPLVYINPGASVVISAPFDGRLGLKSVNVGTYLAPGTPIVPLQDTSSVKVAFNIPQKYLSLLAVGQKVSINVSAYPKKTFAGKLTAINTVVNPDTRSIRLWAEIPNKSSELVPGTFAEVQLFPSKTQAVITIPELAVVYDEAGNYVYRIVGGKALRTPVTLGEIRNNHIVVLKGLAAGDEVVSAGSNKLSDGDAVNVVPAKPQVLPLATEG